MNISVIIPAAGASKRLGRVAVHKPYLKLKDKPILAYSLHKFLKLKELKEIIIAIHPQDQNKIKRLLAQYVLSAKKRTVIKIVKGGTTRQDSVANALQALDPVSEIVLIHDAARPFVGLEDTRRLITIVKKHGAGLLAVPVTDTIKRVNPMSWRIKETLTPRNELWIAQTPQGFKTPIILQAHQYARSKRIKATDDAHLVESLGYPVKVVKGSAENTKITTRQDLMR